MNNMIDTKDTYSEKVQAQFEQLQARVMELRAKAKVATADAKIGIDERLHELDLKMDVARENMEELRTAGEDGWERLKAKIDGVFEGIQRKVEEIT